jgi:hypothetical protein
MELNFMKHDERQTSSTVAAFFLIRTICNQPVMPRECGASSNHSLAITGSPAFAGDDG